MIALVQNTEGENVANEQPLAIEQNGNEAVKPVQVQGQIASARSTFNYDSSSSDGSL